jgi:hypothetical protein
VTGEACVVALVVTVNVPLSVPTKVGLKVTVIVHVPLAAIVCPLQVSAPPPIL